MSPATPPSIPPFIGTPIEDDFSPTIVFSIIVIMGPFSALILVLYGVPHWRRWRTTWLKNRRLTKPFHRWAFRQGKQFTAESIDESVRKYAYKYLRKRQKLECNQDARSTKSQSLKSLSRAEIDLLVNVAMGALCENQKVAVAVEASMAKLSEGLRDAFAKFIEGLNEAVNKNVGLSHAKVPEVCGL